MPTEPLTDIILRFVEARDYQPLAPRPLLRSMGLDIDQEDFDTACEELQKAGRIERGPRNSIGLPAPPSRITGEFRGNRKGFGFIIPETPTAHGDLYVPKEKSLGAMTGDVVQARVLKRGNRDGKMLYEARITKIIKRGRSRFVGELHFQNRQWYVITDGNLLHSPIRVDDPGAKGARPGDQVVLEMVEYPDPAQQQNGRGVIIKVLGPSGEPDVDTQSIIEQYELPGDFEESVLSDAREVIAAFDLKKAMKGRDDLSGLTIITIDPNDARDFDDAISLTENEDGTVELGVHIADVAYFVTAGSALDKEAVARSNSIYLPRMVIPMLPEVLSNGLCSLQEKQPRLTKSAFITYDPKGKVVKTRFSNSVICSTKRLTYEQADAILLDKKSRTPAKVVALLKDMEKLAKFIRRRRLAAGMLELDLPDRALIFDDQGNVTDVAEEESGFPHKIIEMFMVEANDAVSAKLTALDTPHLRRVHDVPKDSASSSLLPRLLMLGHKLPDDANRFDFQKLLKEVKGRDESFAVNMAVLRSMNAAEYAPIPIGHYALASVDYCHFTSPIRRYADLTIHRLLDEHLSGFPVKKPKRKKAPTPASDELIKLGKHCTRQENQAESAERELKLVLLLRHLEAFVGDSFKGIVTGVTNAGLFVQLQRYLVDGLLRFEQLGDDWWEVDSRSGCVVGNNSGVRVTLGDRLTVVIADINVSTRQLDLALVEPMTSRSTGHKKRSRSTNKRGSRSVASNKRKGGRPFKRTKSKRGRRSR